MTDWTVVTTFSGDATPDNLIGLAEALAIDDLNAHVSRVPVLKQVRVTVHGTGDIWDMEKLAKRISERVQREPIGVEILTDAEQARRAEEPTMPELMSAVDVAEELGVSRQRVHTLRTNPRFPAPLAELGGGAVWDARAIRAFDKQWDRKPGRPSISVDSARAGLRVAMSAIEYQRKHGLD